MRDLKQPRALATRDRIVDAAARLFALKGYHDTKLDEVLRTAHVTTGAFFHHFDGKEDLGFAVIDGHMDKRRRRLERIEDGLPTSDPDQPLERVFRHLDAIAEMARQRARHKGGCIIGNLSTTLSDTHEAFRERLAQCFDEMAREFAPDLEAAARRHCPKRRVNTWELARYVVAIVEGAIMLSRTHQDHGMMARQFAYLKQHLREALRIPSALRRARVSGTSSTRKSFVGTNGRRGR